MTKYKKTAILLVLTLTNFTVACKKNADEKTTVPEVEKPVAVIEEKLLLPVQLGSGNSKITFSYLENHSISKIEYAAGKTTVMRYNTSGKPVALMKYKNDELIAETDYRYDQNGLLTKGTKILISGDDYVAAGYYTLGYSSTAQLTTISYFNADGKLLDTQQKTYNSTGTLVTDKSNNASLMLNYGYDDKNGMFKLTNYGWLLALEQENSLFLSSESNIISVTYPMKAELNMSYSYVYNGSKYPETITTTVNGKSTNEKVIYKEISK